MAAFPSKSDEPPLKPATPLKEQGFLSLGSTGSLNPTKFHKPGSRVRVPRMGPAQLVAKGRPGSSPRRRSEHVAASQACGASLVEQLTAQHPFAAPCKKHVYIYIP